MILTFDHESVRELRLNRPPVNALSIELISALRRAIEEAPQQGVRALVISGAPGRFSAGLDLPLLLTLGETEMKMLWDELYSLLRSIATSPVPIVAAITGHAPAGGAVLSLFCDWRVMAAGDFKIGLNEVQVGIPLPPVILAGLRRLVGFRLAERLAVSGALISPADALHVGLVDELAPVEQVIDRALAWCNGMLALPRNAMTTTRQEARNDLSSLFTSNLDPELERVLAGWWHPETQSTLRAIAAQLGKKKAAS
jgi:Delta3-Delta2-enoyl-CoA isomerase